jgi:hypothetical protein
MKEMIFHLIRMSYRKFLNHPALFELYGIDFMMDTDLNLWFFETLFNMAIMANTPEKFAL